MYRIGEFESSLLKLLKGANEQMMSLQDAIKSMVKRERFMPEYRTKSDGYRDLKQSRKYDGQEFKSINFIIKVL